MGCRARFGASALWKTLNATKRTSVGGAARFGASALWKTVNATKRTLQAALWDAARTRPLTPTYALNRARAHSLTHTLTYSFSQSLLFTFALFTKR